MKLKTRLLTRHDIKMANLIDINHISVLRDRIGFQPYAEGPYKSRESVQIEDPGYMGIISAEGDPVIAVAYEMNNEMVCWENFADYMNRQLFIARNGSEGYSFCYIAGTMSPVMLGRITQGMLGASNRYGYELVQFSGMMESEKRIL